MHATIQKPIEEIVKFIKSGERVFVVGCNNCAWKCHSGGEEETENMAKRLIKRGVKVAGYTVPGPQGMSLCKLDHTRKVLMEDYADPVEAADSFLVLGCGQGVHTVIDATDGGMVHPGCDTIFGGETVSATEINEYCSLCGECITEHTGGLCPITLCAKSLLNGPCGGAENGKCEVDKERDCGWVLIYERLKKLGSLAACVKLKENGHEPIYQLTCRDRNRIALQSDILTAYSLGIDNMLLLTGDHSNLGDHKDAKNVFDLDSVQLIRIAAGLKDGHDMIGNPILNPPDMSIGAVVNPNFEPLDLQLMKMEKKIEAGAEFFQTQAVYDLKVFEKFIEKAGKLGRPIQAGVVFLKSPGMGRYMNANVSGIKVPQDWIDAIGAVEAGDRKKQAARMMADFTREIKPMCQGIHFMPLGWVDVVGEVVDAISGDDMKFARAVNA